MESTFNHFSSRIKNKVSKQKKRYTDDGFDLDLTYITRNLIAMGFPAEGKCERIYRNSIEDVVQLLEKKHGPDYKVYNLCSEKSYDHTKFRRYSCFPFDDHNPPTIELIQNFCKDVQQFLRENPKHTAAVHCKAGKGRTGTMICCYLLHDRQFTRAEDALAFYAQERTHDKKGVTIPSQRRYVEYYAKLLNEALPYEHTRLKVQEIHLMSPPPNAINMDMVRIYFAGQRIHSELIKVNSSSSQADEQQQPQHVVLRLAQPVVAWGEVQIQFYHKQAALIPKEKLFHFWFNTFFVQLNHSQTNGISGTEDDSVILTLAKNEIDLAHKDKQNRIPSDLKIKVVFKKDDGGPQQDLNNSLNNNNSISSSLSPYEYQMVGSGCGGGAVAQRAQPQTQQQQQQQPPSHRQNNHNYGAAVRYSNSHNNNNNHQNHNNNHNHTNNNNNHKGNHHPPLLISNSGGGGSGNDEELLSLGSLNNDLQTRQTTPSQTSSMTSINNNQLNSSSSGGSAKGMRQIMGLECEVMDQGETTTKGPQKQQPICPMLVGQQQHPPIHLQSESSETSCSDSSTEEDGWDSEDLLKGRSNLADESMYLSSVDKQHRRLGAEEEEEEEEVEYKNRDPIMGPSFQAIKVRRPAPLQPRQQKEFEELQEEVEQQQQQIEDGIMIMNNVKKKMCENAQLQQTQHQQQQQNSKDSNGSTTTRDVGNVMDSNCKSKSTNNNKMKTSTC